MADKLAAQWARIRGRLRAEYGEAAYRSWLKPMTLVGVEGRRVRISVPTRFMCDWIESQYIERLNDLWTIEGTSIKGVDLFVSGGGATASGASLEEAHPVPVREKAAQDTLGAPLDPRFTFENFIVGKPNELAFAAARRVAEAETAPYNPLFLYGGVGLGKTHLMHAIALHLRQTRLRPQTLFRRCSPVRGCRKRFAPRGRRAC